MFSVQRFISLLFQVVAVNFGRFGGNEAVGCVGEMCNILWYSTQRNEVKLILIIIFQAVY